MTSIDTFYWTRFWEKALTHDSNAMQRNATQRNATQRNNAEKRNVLLLTFTTLLFMASCKMAVRDTIGLGGFNS